MLPRGRAPGAEIVINTENHKPNDDEWKRIAGSTQVLVRSRIEIARILQSIADDHVPLLAGGEDKELFIASLHQVNSEQNYILIGCSDNKAANAQVFARGAIDFGANHRTGHVEFRAGHPVEHFDPVPAIRFVFPELLFIRQRRLSQRIRVIPEAPLYCIADGDGITPFEASIVDIGLSGLGAIIYNANIVLPPETVLKGCRVTLPNGNTAFVDIEVLYTKDVVLPNGATARRTGCSFVGEQAEIDKLLRVFVLDLEAH